LSFSALKVSEKEHSDYDSSFDIIPQVNCALKWPLMLSYGLFSTIFTPIIGVILSKSKKNPDVFEEQFCEISDINFLDGNRSVSSYNTDSGERIYFGFKAAGYCKGENTYRFTVGKSVELTALQNRPGATGLKYKNSDIISSLDVYLSKKWTFISSCSYCSQTRHWTRIETGLNFTDRNVSFDITVFRGKQCFYNPFISVVQKTDEQKTQRYKGAIFDISWRAFSFVVLKGGIVVGNDNDTVVKSNNDNHRVIKQYAGTEYKNECASVSLLIERRNFKGGDLKPETIFRLTVALKKFDL
jgi:hypothetical protein